MAAQKQRCDRNPQPASGRIGIPTRLSEVSQVVRILAGIVPLKSPPRLELPMALTERKASFRGSERERKDESGLDQSQIAIVFYFYKQGCNAGCRYVTSGKLHPFRLPKFITKR